MENSMFKLGDSVRIAISGESGVVNGVAFYSNSEPQYRVLYVSSNHCAVEAWWYADQLEQNSAEEPGVPG